MSNAQTPPPASLDRYTLSVREVLEGLFSEKDLPLYTMVRYHLGWVDAQGQALSGGGGKGLRSTLLLLVVEALGGKIQQAMPAAAALELAHNGAARRAFTEALGDRKRRLLDLDASVLPAYVDFFSSTLAAAENIRARGLTS